MERPEYIPQEEVLKQPEQLHIPYLEAVTAAFAKEYPEQQAELQLVLKDIAEQSVQNFSSFKSKSMPGVAFSFSKASISPELIKKLGDNATPAASEAAASNKPGTGAKHQDYFLFTPFGVPPDGHALTILDGAADRFIRLMPRMARAMRKGEPLPEINVYMLGAPTGLGGAVNAEWINAVKSEGLEAHAKLYAEFINAQEPANPDQHLVMQGVSKGAVIAEKTMKYLREDLQEETQRLLDNPAGGHESGSVLKGSQVAAGMAVETIGRALFDRETMQPVMKGMSDFVKLLAEKSGLPEDDKAQKTLKFKALVAEIGALLKGQSLDTEHNHMFIRQGTYDPLSFSAKRLLQIWQRKTGSETPVFAKGQSTERPFAGSHFFIYKRFKKWHKVLNYLENGDQDGDLDVERED